MKLRPNFDLILVLGLVAKENDIFSRFFITFGEVTLRKLGLSSRPQGGDQRNPNFLKVTYENLIKNLEKNSFSLATKPSMRSNGARIKSKLGQSFMSG